VTPELLALFSKKMNQHYEESGSPNSPLALYLDVDFEVRNITHVLEEKYMKLLQTGKISAGELEVIAKERNNVIVEYQITLEVIK
jgi:hypothetical protein